MIDIVLLCKVFGVGWILNILWEFGHCWLYETCRQQSWRKNVPLLIVMALKDGFFIILFYLIATLPFSVVNIFENPISIGIFIALSLIFAFLDERVSVRLKRWEYAPTMPLVFGVGLTPLLEICVTGILTFAFVFSLG